METKETLPLNVKASSKAALSQIARS